MQYHSQVLIRKIFTMATFHPHKPTRSEAFYAFFGAIIAALISLIPWMWSDGTAKTDPDATVQAAIENGLKEAAKEPDLERKIAYLSAIEDDLELTWGGNRLSLLQQRRREAQTELDRRRAAKQQQEAEIAAEQARLEEIRLARIAATQAAEQAALEAERQKVLEAEKARQEQEQREEEARRQKEAELEKQRLAELDRLEQERRKAIQAAEQIWRSERVCRNDNCTSWILR